MCVCMEIYIEMLTLCYTSLFVCVCVCVCVQVVWMRDILKRGIAVHHSGILPIMKEVYMCSLHYSF